MSENRGKQFESIVREYISELDNTAIIRLPDPTSGYLGIRNISDFIVYRKPNMIFLECKSIHGNTFPFANLTKNQFDGMLEMSKVEGILAGVICWWVDNDRTLFLPIQTIAEMKEAGLKSIRYDCLDDFDGNTDIIEIKGKKKKIFFEYDMEAFLDELQRR